MRTLTMIKDGDVILCGESQRTVFEALGYQPTVSTPEIHLPSYTTTLEITPDSDLIRLHRDHEDVLVTASQVEQFQLQGWCDLAKGAEPGTTSGAQPVGSELRHVLAGLDPHNKDVWTVDGLVKLAALRELLGRDVTRAEVDAAWPGFCRQSAKRTAQRQLLKD